MCWNGLKERLTQEEFFGTSLQAALSCVECTADNICMTAVHITLLHERI